VQENSVACQLDCQSLESLSALLSSSWSSLWSPLPLPVIPAAIPSKDHATFTKPMSSFRDRATMVYSPTITTVTPIIVPLTHILVRAISTSTNCTLIPVHVMELDLMTTATASLAHITHTLKTAISIKLALEIRVHVVTGLNRRVATVILLTVLVTLMMVLATNTERMLTVLAVVLVSHQPVSATIILVHTNTMGSATSTKRTLKIRSCVLGLCLLVVTVIRITVPIILVTLVLATNTERTSVFQAVVLDLE